MQALLLAGPSCYTEFQLFMCNIPALSTSVAPALFNAARRCQGLNPSCNQTSNSSHATDAPGSLSESPNRTNATNSSSANRLLRFVGSLSDHHAPAAATVVPADDALPEVDDQSGLPTLMATNKVHDNSIKRRQVLAEPGRPPLPINNSSNGSQPLLNMTQPLQPVAAPPQDVSVVIKPHNVTQVDLATPEEIEEAAKVINSSPSPLPAQHP